MGTDLLRFLNRSTKLFLSMALLAPATSAPTQFIDQCLRFILVQSRSPRLFEREMFNWCPSCSWSNEIKSLSFDLRMKRRSSEMISLIENRNEKEGDLSRQVFREDLQIVFHQRPRKPPKRQGQCSHQHPRLLLIFVDLKEFLRSGKDLLTQFECFVSIIDSISFFG